MPDHLEGALGPHDNSREESSSSNIRGNGFQGQKILKPDVGSMTGVKIPSHTYSGSNISTRSNGEGTYN